MLSPDELFDIRKYVAHGVRTNELVEVVYRNINRMGRLLDGLSLGDLFSSKWESLMPHLAAQASQPHSLVEDTELVPGLLCGLAKHGDLSFERYITQPVSDLPEVNSALRALFIEGVWLPRLTESACCNDAQRKAIARVINSKEVRTRSYRSLFEGPTLQSKESNAIVNRALRAGIIFIGPGYSCCEPVQGGTQCTECTQSSFCSMIIGQNQCSPMSQNCKQ